MAERYLRVNINYRFGPEERAGLERFYQYAAELGVVPPAATALPRKAELDVGPPGFSKWNRTGFHPGRWIP